ncbi:InlB B-repeat-containing protein [Enterococcus sp. DIV0756]|uniref:InlB B-repeat-containing protein n=1 Tax=Enterococcus sp. DIV0756 TaxID=2774636 RepID=UPI003F278ABB
MKSRRAKQLITVGQRHQHFVFKKFNKQLISVVGLTCLLIGNYALFPLQAIANETATTQTTEAYDPNATIPSLAEEEPTQQQPTDRQPIKPIEEQPADTTSQEAASQENTPSVTEAAQEDTEKQELRRAPRQSEWEYNVANEVAYITDYNGSPETIVVPSELDGLPVEIDLEDVLGTLLETQTASFAIESSKQNLPPVKVVGTFRGLFADVSQGWVSGSSPIHSVNFGDADTSAITDMSYLFANCTSLTNLNLDGLDTQNVTSMNSMFSRCNKLGTLDLSTFDTRNVANMSNMFSYCSNLSVLNLDSFNTQNVTSMGDMFSECNNLNDLDLESFDTQNVTSMSGMFFYCNKLGTLDLSTFDTRNVANMSDMFFGCNNLNSLDLISFDTKNVIFMNNMFSHCSNLSDLNLDSFDTKNVTEMNNMFSYCSNLSDLNLDSFDTKNVTEMNSMFSYCSNLATLSLASFDTKNVMFMNFMFYKCSNLTNLNLSSFDTFNVVDMDYMFYDCNNLSTLKLNKNFKLEDSQRLRNLPTAENDGKTTFHWVKDDYNETYDSTDDFITNHNLTDDSVSTYTIQGKHLVTFDTTGGSGSVDTQRIFENKAVTDPNYTGTKDHYSFDGWTLNGNEFDFNTPVTAPMDLMANWVIDTYTVRFHANNGTNERTDQRFDYDEEKKLTPNTFSKAGYTFKEWNTTDDGNENAYSDQAEVKNLATTNGAIYPLYAQWQANTYAINFHENGGEGYLASLDMVYDQEKPLTKNTITRKGYQFDGWNTRQDGQGASYADEAPVKNLNAEEGGTVTLHAQWKAINYTVTFDSNGGSDVNQETYTIEKGIASFPIPSRKGYTFLGWFDGDTKVERISVGETGNRELIAKWKIDKYNVTFDSMGGSDVDSLSYTVEKGITTFPTPTKSGYKFLGWFDDGGTKIENIPVGTAGNIALKAKWELIEYTITFDSKGGSTVSPQEYTIEKGIDSFPSSNRKGYTFLGWFDGDTKVERISVGETGNRELIAKWRIDKYNVTFDSMGGSDVDSLSYTVEKGIDSFPTPTKSGYKFLGWFDDGGTKIESIPDSTTGNIALKAKWELIEYTITFDDPTITTIQYTVESETIALPTASKKGYTFSGWYDGSQKLTEIPIGSTGNKTLTATFDAIDYAVSFDSSGGSDVDPLNYTIENEINAFPTPTKLGYKFLGWYDEDGKQIENIPKGTTGNRTLTAKWELIEYSVTFDSNGGSDVASQSYTIEKGIDSFTMPTKSGYSFSGWFDEDGNKIESIPNNKTGNRTLKAKWETIPYNVIFDSSGGAEVDPQSYTIEKGINSFPTPTKLGYKFLGWYDEDGTKTESIPDGKTGDRTLTARWKLIDYTITFDDPAISAISYTIESDTIKLPMKTKTGYTFLGWLVSEDTLSRMVTDSGKIVQEIKTGSTGNLKLSARWQANPYTIRFDSNGGAGEMAAQTMTYDEAAKLSANAFTRSGYVFVNWNTQADGRGTPYTDTQEIRNLVASGELTLYAQWKPAKTALDDLITKEKETNRNKEDYTEGSWNVYEEALKKAEKVLADPQATSEEITTALTELKQAIANLKSVKKTGGVAIGTSNTTTGTRKTYPTNYSYTNTAKSYPRTGIVTGSGLTIIGLAAVGSALAGWKKRKGK